MTKQIRRSQAEIVATLIGWDIDDVKDMIYQPTDYFITKVYVIGDGYMCAPSAGRKPPEPERFNWVKCGEAYGRPIYESTNA
jgi:hypothetical protein